ncbi:hypothetical protein [Aureispira sp. CCB-E]|uniref:hypothetical protein n=1 Tax=Aureispira sp. CCB-E TaxID=3051121 RepID=UPI0028693095|nr:hypothetical protein [Aureispira sp. CCB-E]WMX13703.1 hypothetical protein QP953_22885 [Aureispira sp. CCB-E]
MENDDLLDNSGIQQDQRILEMVRWWEIRRIPYNIIVGLSGLLSSFAILSQHPSIKWTEILWYAALPYGLFANVAYLAGWVIEILIFYYFNGKLNTSIRNTLLILGTIISLFPFLLGLLLLF